MLPTIEKKTPTLFNSNAVLISSLYGLLLVGPVIVSMLIVTTLQFSAVTVLLPLGTIFIASLLLPLGFGNPYISRLVQPLTPANCSETFVVQLTCIPRMKTGLSAMFEDADDVGVLGFSGNELVYNGDSLRLAVPYGLIRELQKSSPGIRALFAYGPSTTFNIEGLAREGSFRFSERSSWFLPQSHKIAARIFERLKGEVDRSGRPVPAVGNQL